jgi:hypothetical protein
LHNVFGLRIVTENTACDTVKASIVTLHDSPKGCRLSASSELDQTNVVKGVVADSVGDLSAFHERYSGFAIR